MLNIMRTGIVAALFGITAGCGGTSPAGPTPAVVTAGLPAPVVRAGSYTLVSSVDTVARGGQLSVSWSVSSPGEGHDWIEFSKTSDPNQFYGWSGFTEGLTTGTLTLTAPNQAGHYEFRYLLDDGWTDAARSTLVTVY